MLTDGKRFKTSFLINTTQTLSTLCTSGEIAYENEKKRFSTFLKYLQTV